MAYLKARDIDGKCVRNITCFSLIFKLLFKTFLAAINTDAWSFEYAHKWIMASMATIKNAAPCQFVSEDRVASIFRVEAMTSTRKEDGCLQSLLTTV
jgi:hypothetical protein